MAKPVATSGWLNSEASDGTSLPTKGTASCLRAVELVALWASM